MLDENLAIEDRAKIIYSKVMKWGEDELRAKIIMK